MTVAFTDCTVTEEIYGTVGGTTYMVITPGYKEPRALCFRRMHKDKSQRCTHEAGYGTGHLNTGACRFHGGMVADNPPIKTGLNAPVTKTRLAAQIQSYLDLDRAKLLDLTEQLAATRAMFDEFLTVFPNPEDDSYGIWLARFTTIVNTLGQLVERISKVDNRNTLTAAQVLYLRAVMIDLFVKYIPDPEQRIRALREMASRMGGDVSVDMRMSEIPGLSSGSML